MISILGKTWVFRTQDETKLNNIKLSCGLDDKLARILINRKIDSPEKVQKFLNAKLNNTIPNPSLILDIDKGVQRLIKALFSNENILIFGDYDVDGVTSTYLLVKYLNLLGFSPEFCLPNRFSDGYGLSQKTIENAISKNSELLIILDSGINSIQEIETANKFGLDSIILDHHLQLNDDLPKAAAVINPNRKDQPEIEGSFVKNLCAAGTTFLFIIALQRKLRELGFFKNVSEPNLMDFCDVVSLGTLCDVMELRGMNRAIIKYFLKSKVCSLGILALMKEFNLKQISSPEDFSFFLGPAINAAGRLDSPMIALHLLLSDSSEQAEKFAKKLLEYNNSRKSLERKTLAEANALILEKGLNENKGICVFGEGWNPGIIGIIAGKIKDRFQKPAFAISFGFDEIGKGSARSIPEFDLGNFLKAAKSNGIIKSGGGHALAGGFEIQKEKLDDFQDFINQNINFESSNNLEIDLVIMPQTNLTDLYKTLSILEPFGKGVERPTICIKGLVIKSIKLTANQKHLMLTFSDEFNQSFIRAVIFNISSKPFFQKALEEHKKDMFDIACELSFQEDFGSTAIIKDIMLI